MNESTEYDKHLASTVDDGHEITPEAFNSCMGDYLLPDADNNDAVEKLHKAIKDALSDINFYPSFVDAEQPERLLSTASVFSAHVFDVGEAVIRAAMDNGLEYRHQKLWRKGDE